MNQITLVQTGQFDTTANPLLWYRPKDMKHLQKSPSVIRRSCTKHGAYDGPYCPQCYQKAMGSDELPVKDEEARAD